jgi:hypothetical protein
LNFQFILRFGLQASNNGGKCQTQIFILCVPVWERRLDGGGIKVFRKVDGRRLLIITYHQPDVLKRSFKRFSKFVYESFHRSCKAFGWNIKPLIISACKQGEEVSWISSLC